MSIDIHPPAPNPCGSCPYRRDVPSGVWDPEEYRKLPEFDRPTFEQPPSVFLCHQQDGRLCAGWTACHDMNESLGLRIAAAMGRIGIEDMATVIHYTTNVPLFDSGTEAAEHGLRDVAEPGPKANRTIAKLSKRMERG